MNSRSVSYAHSRRLKRNKDELSYRTARANSSNHTLESASALMEIAGSICIETSLDTGGSSLTFHNLTGHQVARLDRYVEYRQGAIRRILHNLDQIYLEAVSSAETESSALNVLQLLYLAIRGNPDIYIAIKSLQMNPRLHWNEVRRFSRRFLAVCLAMRDRPEAVASSGGYRTPEQIVPLLVTVSSLPDDAPTITELGALITLLIETVEGEGVPDVHSGDAVASAIYRRVGTSLQDELARGSLSFHTDDVDGDKALQAMSTFLSLREPDMFENHR